MRLSKASRYLKIERPYRISYCHKVANKSIIDAENATDASPNVLTELGRLDCDCSASVFSWR